MAEPRHCATGPISSLDHGKFGAEEAQLFAELQPSQAGELVPSSRDSGCLQPENNVAARAILNNDHRASKM